MTIKNNIVKALGLGLLLCSQSALAGPGDSHRGAERQHFERGVLFAAREFKQHGEHVPRHHKERAMYVRDRLQQRHRQPQPEEQVQVPQPSQPQVAAVPELDGQSAALALGLLLAVGGLVRERRRS